MPQVTENSSFLVTSDHLAICWVFVVQISMGYLCYFFGRFACKIHIQSVSFSFPLCLTVPTCLTILFIVAGFRASDPCYFNGILPNYLFFKTPDTGNFFLYVTEYHVWMWVLWLFSQVWITLHIWSSRCNKNAPTDTLFVMPMYNGLVIDQSMTLNRRQHAVEEIVKVAEIIGHDDDQYRRRFEELNHLQDNEMIKPSDRIPQVRNNLNKLFTKKNLSFHHYYNSRCTSAQQCGMKQKRK